MNIMDEQSNVCSAPSDNIPNSSSETVTVPNSSSATVTEVNNVSAGECDQTLMLSLSKQYEMDLQCSMSDKSDLDISPTMDVENISHSECDVDVQLIVPAETISETVLEISEVIDHNTESDNIETSADYTSIVDNLHKEELQISTEPTSINVNSESQVDMISKSSTNAALCTLTDEIQSNQAISDTDITSDSLPSLELVPSKSKDDNTDERQVSSSNDINNHSNVYTPITHIHDDVAHDTSSPYEVYARHMFNAPIPPPRRKKKLRSECKPTIDSEEPDMDMAPSSKRLCRLEDLKPSDLQVDDPYLDTSTSMDTAILVEDIPSMDTTLYIDASLTMETANSISPTPSFESLSDVESIPEIPICFSSTRRPLMLPSVKNINLNE